MAGISFHRAFTSERNAIPRVAMSFTNWRQRVGGYTSVSGRGCGASLVPLRRSCILDTIVRVVSISVLLTRRISRAEDELADS